MDNKTDEIIASIRSAVVSHRLLPGTQLREVSLGRLYGVSRTVVRQALQRLAKDGLVDLTPGKIASVAQPTPKEAREIFDLRAAIESHALKALMERATKKDIARLRSHVAAERSALAAGNSEGARKLGADFHILIARLAGNDLLADLLEHQLARIALILVLYQHDYDHHVACLQDEHEQLIDLIASKSLSGAQRLLASHLGVVETSLKMKAKDASLGEDLPLQRALQIQGAHTGR